MNTKLMKQIINLLEDGMIVSYDIQTKGIFIHSTKDVSDFDIDQITEILDNDYYFSGVKNCGGCILLYFAKTPHVTY